MGLTAHGRIVRTVLVTVVCGLTAFSLAGCKDTSPTKPTPSHSASASASPSTSPSPEPSATPSATPSVTPQKGTAIGVDCNTLISPQTIYNFNPNFSLQTGHSPEPGTEASKALSLQGLACTWVNQTSGDLIVVGVAHPAASDLAGLKAAAGSGRAVSGLGDAAWFSASGGIGNLQAFRGPFWVTASSTFFGSADDARDLVASAVAAAR